MAFAGTLWLVSAVAAPAQTLEARPLVARARVGDVIPVALTVRLPPGMELIDQVPHPLVPVPRGIRLVSADTVRRTGSGAFQSTARVAFFRLGPQPVPTLALLYRKAPGEPPDTLVHMPVSVEVVPLLPAGNPPLKDIKPLRVVGTFPWAALAAVALGLGLGSWYLRRRRLAASAIPAAAAQPLGAFDLALLRLDEIEQEARKSGNGVLPLYTGTADVVRQLLLACAVLPHEGLTTAEVANLLPDSLAGGQERDRGESILQDADLVKFAGVRPDLATALDQVARTRALINRWRSVLEPR
jgi:hypothetical protein